MTLGSPTIYLKNIALAYKHQPLFQDFHLTIPAGKCVCLLGPSGIGKSTLLRLIAGLIKNHDTEILRANITTSDNKPLPDRIAYLAQDDCLMPWLNVLNNVLLGAKLRHEKADRSKAQTLLKSLGLTQAIHQRPDTLSGGMRQRTALARTLIEDRSIVLMDEPFSALDAITRLRLQELSATLLKNRTVLLVTHDALEALRLADIIYVLHGPPVTLSEPVFPLGDTPRDLTNKELLSLQAQLLKELTQAHERYYA